MGIKDITLTAGGISYYSGFDSGIGLWKGTCPQYPDLSCWNAKASGALDDIKAVVAAYRKELFSEL